MNKETHWFEKATKFTKQYFSWMLKDNEKTKKKLNKCFSQEYINNLNFTGLDVEPYDILLLSYTGAFLSFLAFFIFDLGMILSYGSNIENIDALTVLHFFSQLSS